MLFPLRNAFANLCDIRCANGSQQLGKYFEQFDYLVGDVTGRGFMKHDEECVERLEQCKDAVVEDDKGAVVVIFDECCQGSDESGPTSARVDGREIHQQSCALELSNVAQFLFSRVRIDSSEQAH